MGTNDPVESVPTLVYDDSCPMCQIYTGGFKKLGWADRAAFASCDSDVLDRLDLDRARHEIPMLDPATGAITYGLDSLFTVIGGKLRFLRPLMALPFAKPMIQPICSLISYNRRQIAGCPPPADGFDCAPDFHAGWVATYIAGAATATVLLGTVPSARAAALVTGLGAGVVLGPTMADEDTPVRVEAVSHAVTSIAVGTGAARLARLLRVPRPLAFAVGVVAGLHQVSRRSFIAD